MIVEKQNIEERLNRLSKSERLSLLRLIDHGQWTEVSKAPVASALFRNLWKLIDTTISGSKLSRIEPQIGEKGFSTIEISGKGGEHLGLLKMLEIEKPLLAYYLVYVEVAPLFRKKGLGTLILNHFKAYLDDHKAIGILDNIIPTDDPSYSIYFKTGWTPIVEMVGDSLPPDCDNYMVYVPKSRMSENLTQPVIELLNHLVTQRPTIDMRDNQQMVSSTIAEFKELNAALSAYFEGEIRDNNPSLFMRYLFTRFVTQVIRFRRHIGELIGYTGGESMEQIDLQPEVASLSILPITPEEMTHSDFGLWGDKSLCLRTMASLGNEPAEAIEKLPDLHRPRTQKFIDRHSAHPVSVPTIGDLMDLGFDPTENKAFEMDGRKYTFERVHLRKVHEIEKKQGLVERLGPKLKDRSFGAANLKLNTPLLLLQDRGNAYLMREWIEAIHWEEAMEQLGTVPRLKKLCETMELDKIILNTVREANLTLSALDESDRSVVSHEFAWFIPWDLEQNEPKLYIDYAGPSLESIWLL